MHQHYATLTVAELTAAQLAHYERMWPLIEALVRDAFAPAGRAGLVLEGSGIRPDRVAGAAGGRVGAVWLTATTELLRRRVTGRAGSPTGPSRSGLAIEKFAGRTERLPGAPAGRARAGSG